jgi:hypothetical protein
MERESAAVGRTAEAARLQARALADHVALVDDPYFADLVAQSPDTIHACATVVNQRLREGRFADALDAVESTERIVEDLDNPGARAVALYLRARLERVLANRERPDSLYAQNRRRLGLSATDGDAPGDVEGQRSRLLVRSASHLRLARELDRALVHRLLFTDVAFFRGWYSRWLRHPAERSLTWFLGARRDPPGLALRPPD